MDLHQVKLISTLAIIHMSHWWQQEGQPARIAPMCQSFICW